MSNFCALDTTFVDSITGCWVQDTRSLFEIASFALLKGRLGSFQNLVSIEHFLNIFLFIIPQNFKSIFSFILLPTLSDNFKIWYFVSISCLLDYFTMLGLFIFLQLTFTVVGLLSPHTYLDYITLLNLQMLKLVIGFNHFGTIISL